MADAQRDARRPVDLARRAEALGANLPPLLAEAQRVAATVAQGVHGRRRVGQGDSFWQFRPFVTGDPFGRIDWRQSAKSSRAYIRETEWEAAQTVHLWRNTSASMHWRSSRQWPEKIARADLLLLALAALLLRGGERAALFGERAVAGRSGLDRLAAALSRDAPQDATLPPNTSLPRHARVVLIGDFLAPLPEIRTAVSRLSAIPVSGHILQVLDPAELDLPYQGRMRFFGVRREGEMLIPRVESVRDAYGARMRAQQEGIAAICAAAGWSFGQHRTDHAPETALLALFAALGPKSARPERERLS
ncbi:MAG TPA: DUF58 domain-containing protein [Acidisphaera sp.]|nr:DUF58 domain-containing protein [Acidisphaera sp.]